MNDEPPILDASPSPNRFPRFAALFSILTPLLAILGYFLLIFEFLRFDGHAKIPVTVVTGLFILALIFLGLILGVVALMITKKQQRKDVFVKAIVGICLNGFLLVLLFVVPFILPHVIGHKYPTTPQGRLDVAAKQLADATTDEERFYALDDAAKESFNVGKFDDANRFATQLLKLAPTYKGNWNYGNAIQDGNLVLGRIAVREGRLEDAKNYLLEAGKSPGSPQMDSFGPNMSLAKDLLEKGERDTVLQYFELCRKFWTMDYNKLNEWSEVVKAGKTPDFGANLVY